MRKLIVTAALFLVIGWTLHGRSLRADPLPGMTKGAVTLASGSPSTATATVPTGALCLCTNQTTQANPVKCAVSGTTLTVTGPNTVTDAVTYACF